MRALLFDTQRRLDEARSDLRAANRRASLLEDGYTGLREKLGSALAKKQWQCEVFQDLIRSEGRHLSIKALEIMYTKPLPPPTQIADIGTLAKEVRKNRKKLSKQAKPDKKSPK